MSKTGIELAIEAAGSQSDLARLLDITPQSVQQWASKGRPPAERVLEIERSTGVSRHDLRPDLYPRSNAA